MHRLFSKVVGIGVCGLLFFAGAPRVGAQPISQQQMLSQLSKQIDWRHATPQEALVAAAALDNVPQADRALKRGAKINEHDTIFGYTPLILAAQKPTLNSLKFFLSKGADVNGRSIDKRQMVFPLRLSRHFMETKTIKKTFDTDSLMDQLEENLAYMKSVPPHWTAFRSEGAGITPLMAAAATGSAMKVRLLLEHGAKPNLATDSGETALMAAAYNGYLPAVEELLKAGAQVNDTNFRGSSALTFAVLEGRTEVARTLLHRGADSGRIFDGFTLPQIAHGFRYSELETMLANHIKWQKSKAASKVANNTKKTPKITEDTVKIINSDGSVEIVP